MRTMNDQDTFAFENREYVSPTVSRDEQLGFIDNFRDVRDKNIARINADTYNLGTQVPSIRGGLGGSNATFESRYVTPYVNSTIQDLNAVAQSTALTQALSNLQSQYKNRYNQAYRAAKARQNNGGGDDKKDDDGGLKIPDGDDKKGGSVSTDPDTGEGYIVMTGDGVGQYTRDGKTYKIRDLTTARDQIAKTQAINPFGKYKDGDTASWSGITFRYIQNSKYPDGRWFVQE